SHAYSLSHRLNILFFSSRRRHTRSKRDWSSDVCSSDLLQVSIPTKKTMLVIGLFQTILVIPLEVDISFHIFLETWYLFTMTKWGFLLMGILHLRVVKSLTIY